MKVTEFDAWHLGTFEIKMKEEDAQRGCHMGSCDADVEELIEEDYIKEQLDKISSEQIKKVLKDYGIENVKSFDRKKLNMYIVWIAAGNICDGDCYDED